MEPNLEPHELQQLVRNMQKQLFFLEEKIETMEDEIETLKLGVKDLEELPAEEFPRGQE
jgi:chromosome segregation ATPase